MKLANLVSKSVQAAEERLQHEVERATRKKQIAEAFDAHTTAHGIEVPQPKWIHAIGIYGMSGSIVWEKCTPDVAVQIMEAFPPMPSVLARESRGTGFKPADKIEEPEKCTPVDGYALTLDKVRGGGEHLPKLKWYTQLDNGTRLQLDVELRAGYDVLPHIVAHVNFVQDVVVNIEDVRIAWPKLPEGFTEGFHVGSSEHATIREVRYSRVDHRSYNNFLVVGQPGRVLELVKHWARVCFDKRSASREAFNHDRANVASLPPAEIREASDYDAEKLRAGTREQWEALRTMEARQDRTLAERHWLEYAEDAERNPQAWPSKPSEYHTHFDYFPWACHWLQLHGLYIVEHAGKPYSYGKAWL